jgi:hypothetical protein
MKMIRLGIFLQVIGLIFEIGGTIIFAESVFLSDEDIKKLSFHEMGGFDPHIQKQLKASRKTGRIGLSILLIGLGLQGIGMLFG